MSSLSVSSVQDQPVQSAAAVTRLATLANNLLFGALLLVLVSTPFEAGYRPLGHILWATFTNLEVTLFLLGVPGSSNS